jgi:hypothetical protein
MAARAAIRHGSARRAHAPARDQETATMSTPTCPTEAERIASGTSEHTVPRAIARASSKRRQKDDGSPGSPRRGRHALVIGKAGARSPTGAFVSGFVTHPSPENAAHSGIFGASALHLGLSTLHNSYCRRLHIGAAKAERPSDGPRPAHSQSPYRLLHDAGARASLQALQIPHPYAASSYRFGSSGFW